MARRKVQEPTANPDPVSGVPQSPTRTPKVTTEVKSASSNVPVTGVAKAAEPLPLAAQAAVPVAGASPLDWPTEVFASGLARRQQNRTALLDWIRTALVEGTDYGRIHLVGKDRCPYARQGEAARCPTTSHWSKPSLFKPGAEKICGLLGVTVHFPSFTAYEQAAVSNQALSRVVLRCELHDSQGRVVAEGIGARALAQDYNDLNKTLKMAGKSAHIDATLRLAGLSEVFTQDLEDVSALGSASTMSLQGAESNPPAEDEDTGATSEPATLEPYPPGQAPATISKLQINYLEKRIKALGLDRNRVLSWLKRASKSQRTAFDELTPELYDRLLPKLEAWAKAPNGNGAKNGAKNGPKPRNGNGHGNKKANPKSR